MPRCTDESRTSECSAPRECRGQATTRLQKARLLRGTARRPTNAVRKASGSEQLQRSTRQTGEKAWTSKRKTSARRDRSDRAAGEQATETSAKQDRSERAAGDQVPESTRLHETGRGTAKTEESQVKQPNKPKETREEPLSGQNPSRTRKSSRGDRRTKQSGVPGEWWAGP